MAEQHGIPMYLSPRFGENSLEQHTPNIGPFGFHLQPPQFGLGPNHQVRSSSSKRTVGRPPGSKNKPKPPMVIIKNNNDIKLAIIEVGAGTDVMETVVQLARRYNSSIMVVHAAGTISNVTLSNPLDQAFIAHGPFVLLGLSGSYVTPHSLNDPLPSSSFPSFTPNLSPSATRSTFAISISSLQGKVIHGVVAGKIMAANNGVTVTTLLFKNPEYHKFGVVTEGDIVEELIDNPHDNGGGSDHGAASGFIGGGCAGGFDMLEFKQD